MSCTTSISSFASASRAWFASGVAHGRILAHHVHAFDVSGEDAFDDLNHRQSSLVIELRGRNAPGLRESLARLGIVHPLVVRIHHRDEPGVGGALHIVLSAQRMQAGTRLANLARHQ